MLLVEHFRSNHRSIIRPLLLIIFYWPSVESSTRYFQVTISLALNSSNDKYTFTVKLVVQFSVCMLHSVETKVLYLFLRFIIVCPLAKNDLHLLYNTV